MGGLQPAFYSVLAFKRRVKRTFWVFIFLKMREPDFGLVFSMTYVPEALKTCSLQALMV